MHGHVFTQPRKPRSAEIAYSSVVHGTMGGRKEAGHRRLRDSRMGLQTDRGQIVL